MKNQISSDFDFLIGSWHVRHRRLRERLVNCVEWDEFDGNSSTKPILGGRGNIEDNVINFPEHTYRAIALRSFDASSNKWAIWWLDERNPHVLDTPVTGSFHGGIGTFYADESLRGLPIRVRFVWSHIAPNSCQWEQAFSADAGDSWETNWVMQFKRTND